MADPVIVRLIGKGLRAGGRPGGVVTRTEEGTPQGGPASPVLAKVSRHVVLDRWFEKKVRPWCQGEAYLTRFADDGVASFPYKRDAEAFPRPLRLRVERFNRALAEEHTRRRLLGRVARDRRAESAEKPEIVDVLGVTHGGGIDRGGKVAVGRIPSQKSGRKFLAGTQDGLQSHRPWTRRDQQRQLTMRRRGFYQSVALPHGQPKLDGVRCEVQRQGRRALRRRRQRHRLFWSSLKSRVWFERPYAELRHPTV